MYSIESQVEGWFEEIWPYTTGPSRRRLGTEDGGKATRRTGRERRRHRAETHASTAKRRFLAILKGKTLKVRYTIYSHYLPETTLFR